MQAAREVRITSALVELPGPEGRTVREWGASAAGLAWDDAGWLHVTPKDRPDLTYSYPPCRVVQVVSEIR